MCDVVFNFKCTTTCKRLPLDEKLVAVCAECKKKGLFRLHRHRESSVQNMHITPTIAREEAEAVN